jgi:hypothetical protein
MPPDPNPTTDVTINPAAEAGPQPLDELAEFLLTETRLRREGGTGQPGNADVQG